MPFPFRSAWPALVWALRLFLAYLFLTASLGGWIWTGGALTAVDGKLADPQAFVDQVRALDLVPDPWNAWIAMGLPWLELATGLALLTPWTALGGSITATFLLGTFTAVLASIQVRGLEVDCGCFGGPLSPSETSTALVWRSVWLILAAVCVVQSSRACRLSARDEAEERSLS